ncbi:hypothetical protein BHM03_00057412 [Ensete ventricosum]|nr:hypothetical protein BHM03_00057412 [Ensete ventricosum]
MVDRLQLWPPPPILLSPSAQELRDQIIGVSLQRSIMWIPLKAVASRRDHQRARLAPAGVAPHLGTVPAHKGGTCGHSTRKSYRPRGSGARLPTRATTPTVKEAARGQGIR